MYVAMKDLEIRGAGNLLGGEQSGHIAGVGFDLYVRMVGEAVADFRSRRRRRGPEAEHADVKVDLPVDAHLPHEYAAGRAAAAGGLPRARGDRPRRGGRRGAGRTGRPLRPVARAGGEPARVARFKVLRRRYGVTEVSLQGARPFRAGGPARVAQLRLTRLYPRSQVKGNTQQVLVPRPTTARIGGKPVVGRELLAWCRVHPRDDLRGPGGGEEVASGEPPVRRASTGRSGRRGRCRG